MSVGLMAWERWRRWGCRVHRVRRMARRGRSVGFLLAAAAAAGLVATCDGGGEIVDPLVPTTITITPETVALDALGDTAVLAARVLDQHGAALSGATVSWSSGDQSVATVSAAGVVTAAGNGTAVVTATAGGATGQARVAVEQRVASVAIEPDSVAFDALGDTALLVAQALDANGAVVSGAVVSWSSADESVATVSGTGLVTTVDNGTAAVTASVEGFQDQVQVVVEQRVASVVVGPDSVAFDALGDTASLAAEALDRNGAVVSGAELSWSSADESVATVSGAGVVTATGNGEAAVAASADGVAAEARVVVEQRVAAVVVGPEAVTFDALGDSARLAAEPQDANGALVAHASVSWSSADESVATVSTAGVVTAAGNGTAAVTASAEEVEGQAQVVVEQRVASVVVTPDWLNFDALGDTAQLAAEPQDANGALVADATVSWTSGDELIATVSSAGVVAAVGNGTATVTASAGDATGEAQVAVAQRIESVLVTPTPLSFDALGDTASLAAEARDPNGALVSNTAVSWSSGDESVATVSGSGLVTSVANGTVAVTATAGGATGEAEVVVAQRIASVAVTPDQLVFNELGGTASLSAEPRDAKGAAVSGADVSWSSDNESVAAVNASGVVTAVSRGSAVVTATAGSATGQAQVTIGRRIASVVVTPSALRLRALGETAQLAAEARDPAGAVVTGVAASWSTANPSIATVSSTGLVTAAGQGTTVVTARIEGQLGSAAVEVDTVPHPDKDGLVALYNATNGASWTNKSNWLTGAPVSEWFGVSLDANERVSSLDLAANGLTGAIPNGLGTLAFLRRLDLSGNSLTGPLPDGMTSLSRLEDLSVDAEVCAPETPRFERWLNRISNHNLAYCPPPVDESIAYLMQSAPPKNYPVALVAGEKALLRVFVTAHNPDSVGIPPVRATFYVNGAEVYTANIPAQPDNHIPNEVEEGNLRRSANAEIPDSVLVPGLEMVIEIDPDSTLDSSVDVVRRIPETGRTSLEVRNVDVFELTVVPFLLNSNPDSTLFEITDSLHSGHSMLEWTHNRLPVKDIEVTVHDPVWTSSKSSGHLLSLTSATRAAEGGTGYWMGTIKNPSGGGIAYVNGTVSFSPPYTNIVAHELGHNLSLRHAPAACGGVAGVDAGYPYARGQTGVWGWNPDTGQLVSPASDDLMSPCSPRWISDYHFWRAFDHRTNPLLRPVASAQDQQVLLLWGGAKADGSVYLNPAFVIDAPPSSPAAGGDYRIVGEAEDGGVLFSLDFDMHEIADGEGGWGFSFAVPVEPSWAGALARVTLTPRRGAGGATALAVLDRDGGKAAVLLRDPETGQIRGVFFDVPTDSRAQADWLTPLGAEKLDVQVSRGIPAADAWRR